MKKFLLFLLSGVLSCLFVVNVFATEIVLEDYKTHPYAFINEEYSYWADPMHTLNNPSEGDSYFNPETQTIITAYLNLYLSDSHPFYGWGGDGDYEYARLVIYGDQDLVGYGGITCEEIYEIDNGYYTYVLNDLMIDLLIGSNGTLNFNLISTQGDFFLKESILTVTVIDKPSLQPVPEPGTFMLLGISLLGFPCFRKKTENMRGINKTMDKSSGV